MIIAKRLLKNLIKKGRLKVVNGNNSIDEVNGDVLNMLQLSETEPRNYLPDDLHLVRRQRLS